MKFCIIKFPERNEDDTRVSIITETEVALKGISVDNGSRPMKFLQRVVKSILRQMNVQVFSRYYTILIIRSNLIFIF